MSEETIEETEVVEQTTQREILHCDHEVCGLTSEDDVQFVELSPRDGGRENIIDASLDATNRRIHICENCFKREFTELDSDEYEVASLTTDNDGELSVTVWERAWFGVELHDAFSDKTEESSWFTIRIGNDMAFLLAVLLFAVFIALIGLIIVM